LPETVHGKIGRVKIQNVLTRTKTLLSKIPLAGWIGGGVFVTALIYSLIFFIPKPIQFSYAAPTCVGQLVLFPDTQRASSDDFTVNFQDGWNIGSFKVASTRLCIEPKTSPKEGTYTAAVAPFGGWIARKQFAITVPEAPAARAADVIGKAISTAEPLKISLTSADIIHTYKLEIADRAVACAQKDAELICEVAPMELAHGTKYTAALFQTYKDTSTKVVEGDIATLQPLALTSASITDGQTIYDAPTSFSFTFDQPVKEMKATLVKVDGEATESVETELSTQGAQATLGFSPLAREATYRLEVTQAVAESGSSLAAPLTYTFTMSGGPKVASVSVGAHSVARNASIIVTLDQPLDASVDIAKLARVEGIKGSVRKKSDTQLTFSIQGGDCTAFTLVIDKGLKSGSNGETSKEAWSFASRTICGYAWTLGTSVKGRAITAYSFGSGSNVILFTGGMHGSEPSGYSTMLAWAQHLQAHGDIVPTDKRVVIVPNTNPDGIAARSRNNSRNVNIDRNFPTANWHASIETVSGTLPTGGGTSAGSEPETAALITLTRQLKPRLEVSFHAQGRLVGANKFRDSVAIGNIYANTVGYKTMYYNAEEVMGYAMSGEYEDWMGEELNIPAILVELPFASGNYLNAQLAALKKMLAV